MVDRGDLSAGFWAVIFFHFLKIFLGGIPKMGMSLLRLDRVEYFGVG
jgi:hypothetical protein